MSDAERDLIEWARINRDRNRRVRRALAEGINRNRIHELTGISRSTINRLLTKETDMTIFAETWLAVVDGDTVGICRFFEYADRNRSVNEIELPHWEGNTVEDWDAALAGCGYERVTDWRQDIGKEFAQVKRVDDVRPVAVGYRASVLDERSGEWIVVDDEPIVGTYRPADRQPSDHCTPDGTPCYRARVETLGVDGVVLDTRIFDLV